MYKRAHYIFAVLAALIIGALLVKSYLDARDTAISIPSIDLSFYGEEQLSHQAALEYHLLVADLAWRRGFWHEAASNYLILAKETQRGDFALLATSAALEAENLPEASQAAGLWANTDFTNSQAQALAAMLSIKDKHDKEALFHLTRLMEYTPNQALPHLMLMTKELQQPEEKQDFLLVLQALSSKYNQDPGVWFALARQAQHMRDYPLALAATDRCLVLQPQWVSAIALRVQLLYQTQEKSAAKDYLAGILAEQPEQKDLQMIYLKMANEESYTHRQ